MRWRKRHAFDVLHRDERASIVRLADLMDHANIRMTQPRGSARFLCETTQSFRIFTDECRKDFQRDTTTEDRVGCEIDFAHPAFADEIHNLVVLDALAGREFLFARRDRQPPGRRRVTP